MNMASLGYQWRLPRFDYIEAKTVEEACSLLSHYTDKAKLIAGGTDLLVLARRRKINFLYVIDLKGITGLEYINYNEECLRIGALVTLNDIENSTTIKERFPIIADSAHKIGTQQIRNVATIGGNLCNAAPSADMAPALIGSGAKAKLKGVKGEREIALEKFFTGPGETALQTGEMLVEINVANPPPNTHGSYLKLPARTAIDLALVGVAAVITLDPKGAEIVGAKIVLGAIAPTPIRVRKAEDIIIGKVITDELLEKAARAAAGEAKPISDVRGSAGYRKKMVRVLTKHAIRQAITPAEEVLL